ncbi:FAD-dependent oxidoreductase, partial [Streptomyces hydrogenans]
MRRAVVMGGSYAGLFAARVLCDLAEEMVVVEPDAIGEDGLGRRTPQRRQLHALLSMGHRRLERWFPGVTDELVRDGARLGEGEDVRFYVDGRLKAPVPEARMLGATRPFLEARLRRRVELLGNARFVRAEVTDLVLRGGRVAGVVTDDPADDGLRDADLVVDATGRSSRLGEWPGRHGWDEAPVDRMRIDLGYATASFHQGDELGGTVIAHSSPGPASDHQPKVTEPGALAAVEGDRWSVVLAGYAEHRPGPDPDPDPDPEEFLRRWR